MCAERVQPDVFLQDQPSRVISWLLSTQWVVIYRKNEMVSYKPSLYAPLQPSISILRLTAFSSLAVLVTTYRLNWSLQSENGHKCIASNGWRDKYNKMKWSTLSWANGIVNSNCMKRVRGKIYGSNSYGDGVYSIPYSLYSIPMPS